MHRIFLWGACAATALIFSSCASIGEHAEARRRAGECSSALAAHAAWRAGADWKSKTYRNGELLAVATADNSSVQICLSEQRGLLLVNDCIAMDFAVATGKPSHPTPTGHFSILEKRRVYASNLYGKIVDAAGNVLVADANSRRDVPPAGATFQGAKMPCWMRLTNTGVGMHIGYVPGRPASHGCIRLKADAATQLFYIVKIGTPVVIADIAPALQRSPGH